MPSPSFKRIRRLLRLGRLRDTLTRTKVTPLGLRANMHRLDKLDGIRFHRVIDNAPLEMSAKDFWIHLNFQLIHLPDIGAYLSLQPLDSLIFDFHLFLDVLILLAFAFEPSLYLFQFFFDMGANCVKKLFCCVLYFNV